MTGCQTEGCVGTEAWRSREQWRPRRSGEHWSLFLIVLSRSSAGIDRGAAEPAVGCRADILSADNRIQVGGLLSASALVIKVQKLTDEIEECWIIPDHYVLQNSFRSASLELK